MVKAERLLGSNCLIQNCNHCLVPLFHKHLVPTSNHFEKAALGHEFVSQLLKVVFENRGK